MRTKSHSYGLLKIGQSCKCRQIYELQSFIKNNVAKATTTSKLKIDKNNFIPIYLRWLEIVKPIIDVNWEDLKKANILDSDLDIIETEVVDYINECGSKNQKVLLRLTKTN